MSISDNANIIMTNIPISPPSNVPVFWIVGSSATLGLNSHTVGTIIAYSAITANSGASANSLIGLNAGVTLDDNQIISYNASTATGGDPHIIALDGSRLDVYEPGFYRMFDSNSYEKRMIVNSEIIRKDGIDMYDKFLITYPNGKTLLIEFNDDNLQINGEQHIGK